MINETHIKSFLNLPENVIPNKMVMIEVIFYWMQDTGTTKDLHTNGLHDIHSHYEMAMDYYRAVWGQGKAEGVLL